MIDAYAHVGLPRFQSVEDYRATMALAGITRALLCAFDACPDIAEVHRAITLDCQAFRGLGLPIGPDRAATEHGIAQQIEAGFVGLRLSAEEIAERPWALDALGAAGGLALVVGRDALAAPAPQLLRYLDRFPDSVVIGGHFAGPTDPALLDQPGAARDLFAHPRFSVVCSRQGIFPPPLIEAWAQALVERLGWSRLMFGTESPVLFWRDEKVAPTPQWMLRFGPSAAQQIEFFEGNAARLVFARPVAPPRPLALPFDPWSCEVKRTVPMWPFGLSMDTGLPARLIAGWVAWGGEARGPLGAYLGEVLDGALPPLLR